MRTRLHRSKFGGTQTLSLTLCMMLVISLFASVIAATPAAASKSSRLAVVTEVGGTVTVQSAGGSKSYDAYVDMALNQGDFIKTGKKSSIVLKVKDREDEVTIGENAEVYIKDLASKGSGKQSKFKMWTGSMWAKVKTLTGSGDEFEVETPTAVMAVRGTEFGVGVDPKTGETYAAVAAGSASVSTVVNDGSTDGQSSRSILLAPSQQIILDSRTEVADLETKVGIIDPKTLVEKTSAKIIETIVKNKADIDAENEEFIKKQTDALASGDDTTIIRGDATSSLKIDNVATLNKISENLSNLVGNVVNTAINTGKVDEATIKQLIAKVNDGIVSKDKQIDLANTKPMDTTAGVDAGLQKQKDEELKKLQESKKAQEEMDKQKQEELKRILATAIAEAASNKEKIETAKGNTPSPTPTPNGPSRVLAQQVLIAPPNSNILLVNHELQLSATLSPVGVSDRLITWKSSNEAFATVDSSGKVRGIAAGPVTITATSGDRNASSSINLVVSGTVIPEPTPAIEVYSSTDGTTFKVDIKSVGSAVDIAAVEIHLGLETNIASPPPMPSSSNVSSAIFNSNPSVTNWQDYHAESSDMIQHELIYSAVSFDGALRSISLSALTNLLTVNFSFTPDITWGYIKIVKINGDVITLIDKNGLFNLSN